MYNFGLDLREEDFPDHNGSVIELAVLEKYLHNPAFNQRFIYAAANGKDLIERTGYYPDQKSILAKELLDGGYQFFTNNQGDFATEFETRLKEVIEPAKVDIFIGAFRKIWVDGSPARHESKKMMRIKASIRDHDRFYFPKRHVFVNRKNAVPESVTALFTPQEMRAVFEITTNLADTCIEDYLQSRPDHDSNSINFIHLHRGIFRPRTDDVVLVEERYLSSYSMAVTVPEVFAQTWTPETVGKGLPAMLGAPYPLFSNRIVMFAPFIRGMTLGQLEVCVAPPLEVFQLQHHGSFPSGEPNLEFDEYEFDALPPGTTWTGPLPDRIIKAPGQGVLAQ